MRQGRTQRLGDALVKLGLLPRLLFLPVHRHEAGGDRKVDGVGSDIPGDQAIHRRLKEADGAHEWAAAAQADEAIARRWCWPDVFFDEDALLVDDVLLVVDGDRVRHQSQ